MKRRATAPPPTAAPQPVGSIDAPAAGAVLARDVLMVSGWVLFPSGPTARVEVRLGERSLGLAELGVPRADVEAELDLPGAGLAGFKLTCDLSAWPEADGDLELSAEAVSVADERLALGPSRVALAPPATRAEPALSPPHAGSHRGCRLLVCTHQLCLGGASRYLLETLEALIAMEAVDPVVLSPLGGPSQGMLEAAGIPVHVSGPAPMDDLVAYEGRVEELAAWAEPQGFEAVFVNTISPLVMAAAEAAGRIGLPALWAIHESFQPRVLWAGCSPQLRDRAEVVMGEARLAVFEAEATAAIFEPQLGERRLTLPYGLDMEPIEAVREGFDRKAARQRLGVPADADLAICVGSIDSRKAQAVLAQAFDLIAAKHPRAHLALAGAGDTVDTAALSEWVAASGSAGRIELIPTTPEIQQWYGVADLLVCASRIESLPRAMIEGMLWELPVLATRIFGLPDLVREQETGWLVEAGDTAALATALDAAFASGAEERQELGRAGRALVERRHRMAPYAATLADLLERAARGEKFSRAASAAAAAPASAPGSRRG